MTSEPRVIRAVPLTRDAYQQYGDVICVGDDAVEANQGTAMRTNWLTSIDNKRLNAKLNVCVFRSIPIQTPFDMKILERHEFSTQMFIPMNAKRYLVVVALGGNQPDLSTLGVFVANGCQGISYKPGVWHHPMLTLDQVTDYTMLVYEDGTAGDCEVQQLPGRFLLEVPDAAEPAAAAEVTGVAAAAGAPGAE